MQHQHALSGSATARPARASPAAPPHWCRRRRSADATARAAAARGPDGGGGPVGTSTRSISTRTTSIRDFILNEAPLKSFDGTYRERPLEPTLEAPYLIVGALPPAPPPPPPPPGPAPPPGNPPFLAFLPPVPGAVSLIALDQERLAAVLASGGRVLLTVVEEGRPAHVAVPSAAHLGRRAGGGGGSGGGGSGGGGGSFACVGRVAGVFGGLARVVAERRAAVQALDPTAGRAQAAELDDRWAYMCRAAAVAEALSAAAAFAAAASPSFSSSSPSSAADAAPLAPPPLAREVALAVEQARDAAREVASELRACRALAAAMAEEDGGGGRGGEGGEGDEGGGAGAGAAAAADAEAELGALLEWCFADDDGGDDGGGGAEGGPDEDAEAARLTWPRLVRLSFAPFAAPALAALAARAPGGSGGGGGGGGRGAAAEEELARARLRAMASTDAGARLEDAAELASRARRRLAAARALR